MIAPSGQRFVLAGGSGFIGQALAGDLTSRGHEVIILTRSRAHGAERFRSVTWDGKTPGDWTGLLNGAEAVVNLAGKSVSCRYTPENRRSIIDSRVDSVRAIGEAIRACDQPPRAWAQAGSLAIYGDPGARICDESAPRGDGFNARVCELWEQAFDAIQLPSTRKTMLRIGLVLGERGGVLDPLVRLARLFLGGAAGSGRQYVSWLHVADLNRMFAWAIEREDLEGVFNATGPDPVTNAAFMHALRSALHRPWSPPVPAPAVRLGAWLMGSEADLVLEGRRCVPKRFLERGFAFQFPELGVALRSLLGSGPG
jgi:uncharacterized protein (TIGR01777 family)